tara:strand:+ start:1019 stop:1321 length:303 start_codon:yes stop_codon:yes gene_type:complete
MQLGGEVTTVKELFNQFKNELAETLNTKGIQQFIESKISQTSTDKENWISRKKTAEKLQCSYPTLKSWVDYGYLNSYKIARRVYFLESEVNEMLKSCKTR